MLEQLLIGSALLIATTVAHSLVTALLLWLLRTLRASNRVLRQLWAKTGLVAGLVLVLFLAALVEVALWAIAYIKVGAIDGFEPALYFSMVTFTTLGYGDVVLTDAWRLLASFEAATGIIVFGWTTAIIIALVQHMVHLQQGAPAPPGEVGQAG